MAQWNKFEIRDVEEFGTETKRYLIQIRPKLINAQYEPKTKYFVDPEPMHN